jgi:hypothetical protein
MAAKLDLGNLLVHLNMNTTQYFAAMKAVEMRMTTMSAKLATIGRQMTLKLTVPLLAIGTIASKIGIDTEEAFIGVQKTVNATEIEFTQLRKEYRVLNKDCILTCNTNETFTYTYLHFN